MHVVVTRSVEETRSLGHRLGAACEGAAVVALIGDLGAGKTAFTQGLARGLDVETRVQSPTFTVIQEHPVGRLPLFHMDLYRVEHEDDLEQLGIYDAFSAEGVSVIEWADCYPEVLPADHLTVRLVHRADGREIRLTAQGPRHQAWLDNALG